MKQAGEALPTDVEASLVVVTDGEDHCGRPTICEVAEQLHESHPMLRIDAISFMIDDDELNCAASTTAAFTSPRQHGAAHQPFGRQPRPSCPRRR